MVNTLIIPKHRLAKSADEAAELIYEYFNGFDVDFSEDIDVYKVHLSANQYTYCEDITKGLRFLGITAKNASTYCPLLQNTALCLSENWLPYALLKLQQESNLFFEELTVIHVDDHQDLMPPFISRQGDCFVDMITGKSVSLSNMDSIRNSVLSGAITIGSMLSAIVYPIPKTNVIHIKQGVTQCLHGLAKETFHDAMLPYYGERICITMKEYIDDDQFYFATSSWEEAEKRIPSNATCVLHIDMDYFNNRYNASTDWKDNPNRLDTSFSAQQKLMDDLVVAVSKIRLKADIKYLLLGFSPSFYPVEFWADGIKYLLTELNKVGIGAGIEILKKHKA